jgi:nitroreductase
MEMLLRSLQLAPSAANRQNREFILVGDPTLKKRLVPLCGNQPYVGECSFFIAGVADPSQKWHQVDVAIALTNFSLQAVELGYGTCWIGDFDPQGIGDLLGVPSQRRVVVCMIFGPPAGGPLTSSRHPIERFIFRERYGSPWTWQS